MQVLAAACIQPEPLQRGCMLRTPDTVLLNAGFSQSALKRRTFCQCSYIHLGARQIVCTPIAGNMRLWEDAIIW